MSLAPIHPIVRLPHEAVLLATWAGRRRHAHAKRRGFPAFDGMSHRTEGAEAKDVQGALAEMGVALFLGLYWLPHIGDLKAFDVGGFLEVRSISRPGFALRVADSDHPESPIVLAYLPEPGLVELRGWLLGAEAHALKAPGVSIGRPGQNYVEQERLSRDWPGLRRLCAERIQAGRRLRKGWSGRPFPARELETL